MNCSVQNYEVLDLLGRGGFACVYRARCISLSQGEVAIKMVKYYLLIIKRSSLTSILNRVEFLM
jgi:polo-like kinase 4